MGVSQIEGIFPLEINITGNGEKTIYPTLIRDAENRILVDCGYAGFLPELEIASAMAGTPFSEINGIVITHHDPDHCGALAEIKEKYPRALIMASGLDAPVLEGKEKSVRIYQTESAYGELSEFEKIRAGQLREKFEAFKPAPVSVVLKDGDVMPWLGGTEIIATPGHLPGHISLFVRKEKTVITGDALIAIQGRLHTANSQYSFDVEMAKTSARTLLNLEADKFICYHGGTVFRKG